MANADIVAFNIAAFISAIFPLEFGADKFIDHTAIVSRTIGVSEAVVALLTAGAEWEELGVVVASLSRSRSSLAVGNVVGSAISNILGAFSLGLLFCTHDNHVVFDRSSKVYSVMLLLITTFVTPAIFFPRKNVWRPCGSILVGVFLIYVISIAWAIGRGRLAAPEDSGSENSESVDESHSSQDQLRGTEDDRNSNDSPTQPLLRQTTSVCDRPSHSLLYHVLYLLLGFFSICLASYILSHAASTITDQFYQSDVLFGVVILAIATTLPEKFVAVISGYRGHMGILVANTVGSNIFLLTLCMGIIMVDTDGHFNAGNVNVFELGAMWGATVIFTFTVWFGAKRSRLVGGLMLVIYVVFLVLDFTVWGYVPRLV